MRRLHGDEVSAGPPRIPGQRTAVVLLLALVLGACTQSDTRGSSSKARTSSRSTTTSPKAVQAARFAVRELPPFPLDRRSAPSLVSTGDSVLVWGGAEGDRRFGDGARYDVKRDRWDPIPIGPLSPRAFHSAVWTGDEMIVWSGSAPVFDALAAAQAGRPPTFSLERVLGDGAAYNPRTRQWRTIALPPIAGRIFQSTAWTGDAMIVWGGLTTEPGRAEAHADGAAYRPANNTRRVIPASPLGARTQAASAWTGHEMVVFGGFPTDAVNPDSQVGAHTDPAAMPTKEGQLAEPSGSAYDPSSNSWRALPAAPFSYRKGFSTTWTGNKVVVWGGYGATGDGEESTMVDGGAWDPRTNTWGRVFATAIGPRFQHVALAADGALLIWGGYRTDDSDDVKLVRDGGLLTDGSAEHVEGSDGFSPVSGPAA